MQLDNNQVYWLYYIRLASEFCEDAGHKDVVEKLEQVMTLFA